LKRKWEQEEIARTIKKSKNQIAAEIKKETAAIKTNRQTD
jgi:hypothetical protein